MTNSLPTLRPHYTLQIETDKRTGVSYVVVCLTNGFAVTDKLASYALPTRPDSYEEALKDVIATIGNVHPHIFSNPQVTERSRYQYALNTLLEENDQ